MCKVLQKRSRVYGVGINDANYRLSLVVDGKKKWCPFFTTWKNILRRCYDEKCRDKHRSYAGCIVHSDWLRFMAFRQWMACQSWEGMQIDKDLLGDGKIYGPETCVFIPRALNAFISSSGGSRKNMLRNGLPRGVCVADNRYIAQVCIDGKQTPIGRYLTPEAAHKAWAAAKSEMAFQWAEKQSDKRIADAIRRFGMSILNQSEN